MDTRMAYSQPTTLADALSALEVAGTQVVAGGTDVYPSMPQGPMPPAFLDVTRIEGFGDITKSSQSIRFGAAVTWSDIVKADLPPACDALKQAAREIGSIQIQNAGTIAGNICNASPAADGIPPLLALGAEVEIASRTRGVTICNLNDFIKGVRKTTLQNDELITAVTIPNPPKGMRSAFEKLGSRRYLVISIAMTAANISLDETGRISKAYIAVGSCSAVAQRLPELEKDLIGMDPKAFEITSRHLAPLTPIDDVRGTKAYRLNAAEQQIRRAIRKAAQS